MSLNVNVNLNVGLLWLQSGHLLGIGQLPEEKSSKHCFILIPISPPFHQTISRWDYLAGTTPDWFESAFCAQKLESQSHRMCWVGMDPSGSSSPSSWPCKEHPKNLSMCLRALSKLSWLICWVFCGPSRCLIYYCLLSPESSGFPSFNMSADTAVRQESGILLLVFASISFQFVDFQCFPVTFNRPDPVFPLLQVFLSFTDFHGFV